MATIRVYPIATRALAAFFTGFALAATAWGEKAAFDRATGASMRLDTRVGTRLAAQGASETIAYSPRWGADGGVRGAPALPMCTVAADGVTLKTASEEGEIAWSPETTGAHTLAHTAGDVTYTAQFTVLGDDVQTHAGVVLGERHEEHVVTPTNEFDYVWYDTAVTWKADKVHLIVGDVSVPSGTTLTIEPGAVVKFMTGTSLTVNGTCVAYGVIFTHVNDDTAGGDTLMDGDATKPVMDGYKITGNIYENDSSERRYETPQTLTPSISGTVRLKGHRVYLANSSITVNSGATLTLLPGAIIKFASGCSMTVNGTLDAQGTRAAPIVFTSQKDDDWGGDTNGDGEKTYAQAGDWGRIYAAGTVNMNYCRIRHCNNTSDQGAIQGSGGTVTFDNGIIESSVYECVRMNSGRFVAHNSVFRDSSMGFGYYGGSGTYAYNCVIADCSSGCRASNKHFYNTVFYRCNDAFLESTASSCDHCVFYNPPGYGPQTATQVGSNGNIWGDPKFLDPDNSDFRIAADSPCVDAGDGTVAPELDYWGQPRMDAKGKAATGVPNADGVCPDIGIYEFPGKVAAPVADLAILSVTAPATAVPGEEIALTYVITNRGAAEAVGLVRDQIALKGADAALGGQQVTVGEVEQLYSLAAGAAAMVTARVKCPAVKGGNWLVGVTANAERDVFEQVTANNTGWASEATAVELETLAAGESRVTVGAGAASGFVVAAGVRTLRVASDAALDENAALGKIAVYGANGAVPSSAEGGVAAIRLGDGSWLLVLPEAKADEKGYVVIENGGNTAVEVKVTAEEEKLAVFGVAPARVAAVDGVSVTITGTGLADDLAVTLGGRTATRVTKVGEAQIVATFDLKGVAAGAAEVAVSGGAGRAALPVEVYKTTMGPKLEAKLVLPSSVREGRIYTAWVEYANVGDEPMTAPIFTVKRTDSATNLKILMSDDFATDPLHIVGIGSGYPAGVLAAGDSGRIPFYFMPSGAYRLELSHVKDETAATAYKQFADTADYRQAVADAATRLNARGRKEYRLAECVDFVIEQRAGRSVAAISGVVHDSITFEPLPNIEVRLTLTNDTNGVVITHSDENGFYSAACLDNGTWAVDPGGVGANRIRYVEIEDQVDVSDLNLSVYEFGVLRGTVLSGDENSPLEGVEVRLHSARTGGVVLETMTDDKGSFEIREIMPDIYDLAVNSVMGYVGDVVTNINVAAGMSIEPFCFVLKHGGRIHGCVKRGGVAVTNGVVEAYFSDSSAICAECDKSGCYSFDGMPSTVCRLMYRGDGWTSRFVEVDMSGMEDRTVDLEATLSPMFFPVQSRGYGALTTQFLLVDSTMITNNCEWAWDFNDDGIVDSRVPEPIWTFNEIGTYHVKVSVSMVSGNVESWYSNCVQVVESIPNVLASGACRVDECVGLSCVDVGADELILEGTPPFPIAAGVILGGQYKGDWYIRRVVSFSQSGSQWMIKTEDATIDDLYESYCFSGVLSVDEETVTPVPFKLKSKAALFASKPKDRLSLIASGGVSFTYGFEPKLSIVYENTKRKDGKSYTAVGLVGEVDISGSFGLNGRIGARYEIPDYPLLGYSVPAGPFLYVKPSFKVNAAVSAYGEGKGEVKLNVVPRARLIWENVNGAGYKLCDHPFDFKFDPDVTFSWSGNASAEFYTKTSIDVSAFRVGPGVEVYKKDAVGLYLRGGAGSNLKRNGDVEGFVSPTTLEVKYSQTYNFEWKLFDLGNTPLVGRYLSGNKIGGSVSTPAKTLSLAKYTSPVPDFLMTPSSGNAPLEVTFKDCSKSERVESQLFKLLGVVSAGGSVEVMPAGYKWDFQVGRSQLENASARYSSDGNYKIKHWAQGTFLSTFTPLVKRLRVGDVKDPEGPIYIDDNGGGTPAKSSDPNEMAGPLGTGDPETERFVKPGEWMDYTIYFENKADADVPAQEVFVDAQLSEYLDWSTFEMGEVAFNNQNETVLAGLKNGGPKTVAQNGADYKVQLSVAFDETTGAAHWYLRSYDPSRSEYNNWPAAVDAGFLPPNDETHRGEGHITYRVKVREDAPKGARIDAAATIVFDKNDPIETDPAWWNTVGSAGGEAAFDAEEMKVDEGGTMKVIVNGGNADLASSVQVQVTYNTAAAADLDLKNAAVNGATVKSFKFPVTLEWAAGETGEKTVEIPVIIDKSVEADEFLTLQLQNPMNLAIAGCDGEGGGQGLTALPGGTCTVTIHDPQYDALKAAVEAGTATKAQSNDLQKIEKALAGKSYVRALANDATRGKVTGSVLAADGKKVTLKATANKGWVFAGWHVDDGARGASALPSEVGSAPRADRTAALSRETSFTVTVSNDVDYIAWFIAPEEDSLSLGEDFLPSEFAVGEAVSISVPVESVSLPTVTVSGLPSGLKYYAKETPVKAKGTTPAYTIPANTIFGTPTKATAKPATVTVTVKNLGGYQIVRKYEVSVVATAPSPSQPAKVVSDAPHYYSVAVSLSDDFAGKVTGAGVYQAGKKVTLKATANKGYVFNGWYEGVVDGGHGVAALPSVVGSAPRADRTAVLSQAASYAVTMPEADVAYEARFVTAAEDKASIGATVDGMAFGAAAESGGSTGSATNVMCGVYLEWPVAASALSEPTVAVSGLPSGLKFTAKPVTSKVGSGKSAVTVTNVPPNTIYGAPSAASKTDKSGNVTPSKVKVTVTTAGKSKAEYVIDLTVDPLPAWAVGEFGGLASTPEGRLGSASMSVTAAGKVSGKVIVNGTNCTFTASSYDITSKTVGETNLVAKVTGKLGKEAAAGVLTVGHDGEGAVVTRGTAVGSFAGAEMALFRNVWKDKGADPVPEDAQGLYTVKLGAGERGTGYLSLTVDKKGAVKVAGKAPDGTALSATATLMPDGDGAYFADVFAAPSAYKGGYVAGRLGWDEDGRVSSDGLGWTSFNPESTADYYAGGFDRGLSASGVRYVKDDAPKTLGIADVRLETPVGATLSAFSFTQATGVWKGTLLWDFGDPSLKPVKVPFEGVMVQGEDLEGFGAYDVSASYVPYDKNGKPQAAKTYKVKESVPVGLRQE